jgi:protease PrsW
VIWLAYFYRKAHGKRRSFWNVVRVFLAGCACTIPVGIIEHATGAGLVQDTLLRSGTMSFLLIAPLEELSKLAAVWLAVYRRPDFREPLDGIIYSGTAAMGFASVENIVYLVYLGPGIIVSRALFATPAHVMFSSMWGYSLGLARFRREGEISTITKGLVISALLHGTYNFLVALHPKTAMFSLLPLMIFMGWLMNRRIQDFRRNFPFPSLGKGAVIYCPNCGAYTPEKAETCNRCGFQIPLVETDAPRFCGRCRARLAPGRGICPSCGERIVFSEAWPSG